MHRSGVRLVPNPEHGLLFDVFDSAGERLSREDLQDRTAGKDGDQILEQANRDRLSICCDGDSWTNMLWPLSSVFGHDPSVFEIIEMDRRIRTLNKGYPGDTLADMVSNRDYKPAIQSGVYDYFFFSGAGNDILGGGRFRQFLLDRNDIDPSKPPETWFDANLLNAAYAFIEQSYRTVAKDVYALSSRKTTMLVHGYDYAIPRRGGPWIGNVLSDKNYSFVRDAAIARSIVVYLVDRLYDLLDEIAKDLGYVKVLDFRKVVNGRWNDELHPMRAASEDLAKIFKAEILPMS